MKKLIKTALLLAIVLTGLFALPAQAEETVLSGSGWTYDPATATLTITSNIYDYRLASSKSDWFIGTPCECNGIDTEVVYLVVEEGVTKLGDMAFYGFSNLQSVRLPSTLTEIGSYTFYGARKLGLISIPASVKTIGHAAFAGCPGIGSIYFYGQAPTIDRWDAFYDFNNPNYYVFYGCTANVYYKPYASWTNTMLSLYSTNATLTWIPEYEAKGTWGDNLTWILQDDGTLSITGSGAIPDFESSSDAPWYPYRNQAFALEMGYGITRVGSNAFGNMTSLRSLTTPTSLTGIGDNAFYRCLAMKQATLANNVTTIEAGAFEKCTHLTKLTLPDSVTTLGERAFAETTALGSLTLGSGVKSLPAGLLKSTGLSALVIPEGVETIGSKAFADSALTEVTIPLTVTGIAEDAFDGITGNVTIACHADSCAAQYAAAAGMATAITPHTEEAIPALPSTHVTHGLTEGVQCPVCGAVLVPQESLPLAELTVTTLPASLTHIHSDAFNGSAFECIVLPEGCKQIYGNAFANCTALRCIQIPASVTGISTTAFTGHADDLVIVTTEDSAAHKFAVSNDILFALIDP